jgi:hypothetical protein
VRQIAARAKRGGGQNVSVAGRTNIVAKVNVGEGDAMSVATARQGSPIVQGSADATASADERAEK